MGEQELNKAAETELNEQSAPAGQTVQDDPNTVTRYRNMLVMNVIVVIALFIAWFVFRDNIIISLIAMILCALPLKDASAMLKDKDMMQRNGMQRGNIVGVAVAAVIDVLLWAGLFVYQLLHLTD